ncbi:hypothetical protein QAO71_17770 (plasmid) [Halopseudomonas sp. SMJS2]|uniref:hypothetical protein n=1 Tax=Halopseudomonas sp. SMJS2 TaxID=3041098 RepID=UPI0024531F03|nr:hypothetical protein [Halopseudomonas sp. SMJS2]WGK63390.1 hypothetical protein QAO71_17770 [Halopseudomonas sp. SMJS2]
MKKSIQIITSPLLRQFAVETNPRVIEVISKLGNTTISRTSFCADDFPSSQEGRESFLMESMKNHTPKALEILSGKAGECISDQVKAVAMLIDIAEAP